MPALPTISSSSSSASNSSWADRELESLIQLRKTKCNMSKKMKPKKSKKEKALKVSNMKDNLDEENSDLEYSKENSNVPESISNHKVDGRGIFKPLLPIKSIYKVFQYICTLFPFIFQNPDIIYM